MAVGLRPRAVRAITRALGLALIVSLSLATIHAATRTFGQRFSVNDTGDIVIIGNTLVTCPDSDADCAGARAGTNTGNDNSNNGFSMVLVDLDSDATTINSSSATFTLPPGATVLFAGLYWGADSSAASRNQIKFATPATGGAYIDITASEPIDFSGTDYQGFSDVTSQVLAGGTGVYTVANVQASTGTDRHAGWALVVAFRDPSMPARNLTVFDGLQVVNQANPNVDITVSGFQTPPTGAVLTSVGVVAYEGDRGSDGDGLVLDSTPLTDVNNPAGANPNFFNSTISSHGTTATAKTPNYVNQLGFDADIVDANGVLANNATSATIHLTTGGETYLPGVVTFVTQLYAPQISAPKSVVDLNGGNLAPGDILEYTIVVTNTGQDAANTVITTDPIPANTTYVPGSLQIDGAPKTDATGDDTAYFDVANNRVVYHIGTGATAVAGGTLAENGGSATLILRAMVNPGTPNGATIFNQTTTSYTGATSGTSFTTGGSASTATVSTPTADLSMTKTNGSTVYTPGTNVTYTIVVTNNGPDAITGAQVNDPLPSGITTANWTCVGANGGTCGTPSGTGAITNALVNLPVSGTATFALTMAVPSGRTGSLTNTATVAAPGSSDPNPNNNSATDVDTIQPAADIGVTKTDHSLVYSPGTNVTYTIVASNAGPSDISGLRFSDPRPAGITTASWTCTGANGAGCTNSFGPVSSGTGGISQFPNATVFLTLPANSSVTFLYTIAVPPTFSGNLVNTASFISGTTGDPDATNNSATDTDTVAPADLTITKVSTPNPFVPGGPFTYTIVASNLGPGYAPGATIADTLPSGLTGVSWTCTGSGGATCGTASSTSSAISTLANLPSGGSVTIVVHGTAPPSTTDVLSNTASIVPPSNVPDPVMGNNVSTDTNPATQADLRIAKGSAPSPYVPGDLLTYTVVVTNAGPDAANGARVEDPLPPAFAAFTWTCAASAGATCTTASGTGDINALVDLPAGGSATFTSSGMVPSGYLGTAANTATITPPPDVRDPVPGNNIVTTPNAPGPKADLTIMKAQSPDPYVAGQALTYTLLVNNLGPSDVTNARVQDVLPGVVINATWTCAASGAGASCGSANGVNIVDAFVTLPAGTSATFLITGTVLPSATGVLSNTATATAPSGVTDPVPGSNQVTVNSNGAPEADLAIVKSATPNPYVPGAPLTFTIVARNTGPSDAMNARVQDLFPLELSTFEWTCAPSAGAATCGTASGVSFIDTLVNLPVGGAVTFTVTGTVPSDTTGPLTNTATVAPPVGVNDPDPASNLSGVTLGSSALADLSLTKTSSPNPYVPGAPITYTIVASNAGPSALLGGRVRDGLPAALQNVTWTCAATNGTCPAPNGTGNVDALVNIDPGGTVTFTIVADVPGGTRGTLVNAATIVPPPGLEDPTPTNNSGVDYNPSIPIPGNADLQITQVAPGVAAPNGLLTFRLVTRNLGSHPALNPYITGMIPPGTTFVSANPGPDGTCTTPENPPAPDRVTGYPIGGAAVAPLKCTWPGLMNPDQEHVLEFTVRVSPGTPTGQILWSCFWTWSETDDPYHANNVVDSYLFVNDGTSPVGDLALQGGAMSLGVIGPDGVAHDATVGNELAVPVGGTVKIRFWSTNAGPVATRGQYALILDTTAGLEVVDAALAQGWISPSSGSSAVWETGQVQPGQTVSVDLTVRFHSTGALKLFAQRITGAPGDPNATNERATVVLDGYGPTTAGRWVAVGDVDGAGAGEIVTGTGEGETPQVRVYTGTGADTGVRFFAYERPFLGGVRIASCDVNGDGIDELITAPGPGRASTIRVLRLIGGVVTELVTFDAFEAGFTGGASIACADLDADGSAELVVGAGPGRAPEVQVYNVGVSSIVPRATFLAYEAGFLGGVRVAAGVYPGRAGWLEPFAIATTPGTGRPAELRLWTPTGGPVAEVVVSSATKGVLPTLGDVNGDGQLDLLLTPDDGRPELVRIFSVDTGEVLGDVPGNLPGFPVGIRTAVGALEGGPGQPEIVIGNGPGGHPRVRVIFWPPSGPVQRLEILPLEIP